MSSSETAKKMGATREDTFSFDPETLVVVTDENHPLYDPRVKLPLEEATIASIQKFGVIMPVIVRKNGDKYEVVDGRQRVLHAREANRRFKEEGKALIKVPSRIRRAAGDLDTVGVMITTNEVRLDDTVAAKAKKLQKLLALGATEAEAAVVFGCTTASIKNYLAFLDCAPIVQKAIEEHVVPASVAKTLAKVDREEQAKTLSEMVAAGATKGRAAAKAVKKGKGAITKPSATPTRATLRWWLKELLVEAAKSTAGGTGLACAVLATALGEDSNYRLTVGIGRSWKRAVETTS
jgi:ParB family chromosome partitioning protein